MNYKNSKHIKNRRIGESELELLFGVFSQLCEGDKKGSLSITVKGEEFGEFSSGDRSALDAMKLRRKPVSEVEFVYRSENYDSHVCLSISDEFSSLFSYSLGTRMSIDSTDELWFNATWQKMENVVEAIPCTPCISQILNRWRSVIAVFFAIALSFCTIRIICRMVRIFGGVIPDSLGSIVIVGWVLIGGWYHGLISNFICKNYPVVDLNLYKTRAETRRRCSRFFWWLVSVLGSLTIATYWPFGGRNGENDGKMSPAAVLTETNRPAVTQDIQGQVEHDKEANQ